MMIGGNKVNTYTLVGYMYKVRGRVIMQMFGR